MQAQSSSQGYIKSSYGVMNEPALGHEGHSFVYIAKDLIALT
jgi:hypothetical protein